jgi:hypothetical protein
LFLLYSKNLTSFIAKGGVIEIEDYAFQYCDNLTTFKANGIEGVGVASFQGCFNLVTFGSQVNLKRIGTSAFEDCTKLIDFNVPMDAEVGRNAFRGTNTKYKNMWILG